MSSQLSSFFCNFESLKSDVHLAFRVSSAFSFKNNLLPH
ncbi:hypothetical protein SynRS9902_01227 [Synechococcus sp. RS9902]|nr:hypothetical protein SynRS9902_01227 [Synechococcus sp. RS9902]